MKQLLVLSTVALLACGSPSQVGPQGKVSIVVAGSSTLQPIIEEAAPIFEEKNVGKRVEIQGGGSGAGIKLSTEGKADIGMVSRDLKPEEAKELVATKIGDDGIALFVHKSNPVNNLTKGQVVALYSGTTTNWKDLGGSDLAITLITKEEGRSTLELFAKHFGLEGKIARDAVVIGPNGQAITTVEGNPGAIAYVSIGSAEKAIEQGSPIKMLTLDGIVPSTETVRNKTYPLCRPLNLVTRGAAKGLAKDFIDFLISPEGQKFVIAEDFVPLAK